MNQDDDALQSLRAALEVSGSQIDQEAQRGDKHTLDLTVRSHVPVLTLRYVNTTNPLALIETEIHHFWRTVITAARHWGVDNPKQDTLVRYILSARARGTLTRPPFPTSSENLSLDVADQQDFIKFSDGGKLWSDLPLLSHVLMDEWTQRFYTADYDGDQRCNLSAFVGRLISVGIWDGPAACALSLFRETLETSRPLVPAAEGDTDQGGDNTQLPVETLLLILLQILHYSEERIIDLSNDRAHIANATIPTNMSALGELAVRAGVSSPGYNPHRWRFWMERLHELENSEFSDVSDRSQSCVNMMKWAAESINGPLAREPSS